jgi:hypothetical protein
VREGSYFLRRTGAAAVLCLLAVVGPLAAVAHAAPPGNDDRSAAERIPLTWVNQLQKVATVPSSDWSQATAGGDPQPSCTGPGSDHSQWWSISVPEAGTLKVTVNSANPATFLPVVTLYDASGNEIACSTTSEDVKANPPPVNVNAYVFPIAEDTPQTYLVRVAEAIPQAATGRQSYDLFVTGHDLTAPHVQVTMPKNRTEVRDNVTYDAMGTVDRESLVDLTSGVWTFKDGYTTDPPVLGMTASHRWKTPGLHKVTFTVKDNAGNSTTYTFFVFVHDFTPPKIGSFGVKRVPFPGDRWLTIVVTHDEPITLRVTVMQGTKLLYRNNMRLLKGKTAQRRIHLRRKVAATPWISISGSAKDSAGNITVLPGCQLDPVKGGGKCFSP